IAIELESYADESGPRKRIEEIEADLMKALYPEPVAVLRRRLSEIVPKPFRKSAENGQAVMLS
ncbi:MAG: hypothetical protein ACYC6A_21630, partial [Armatimonadota bacterium]